MPTHIDPSLAGRIDVARLLNLGVGAACVDDLAEAPITAAPTYPTASMLDNAPAMGLHYSAAGARHLAASTRPAATPTDPARSGHARIRKLL
jgi:hypothetical protein